MFSLYKVHIVLVIHYRVNRIILVPAPLVDVVVTTPPEDVVVETEQLGNGDFGVVFKGYELKS